MKILAQGIFVFLFEKMCEHWAHCGLPPTARPTEQFRQRAPQSLYVLFPLSEAGGGCVVRHAHWPPGKAGGSAYSLFHSPHSYTLQIGISSRIHPPQIAAAVAAQGRRNHPSEVRTRSPPRPLRRPQAPAKRLAKCTRSGAPTCSCSSAAPSAYRLRASIIYTEPETTTLIFIYSSALVDN